MNATGYRRGAAHVSKAKTALLAFGLSLLLATAFVLPILLSSGLVDAIGPLARHYCPETGKLAPRYWQSRSSRPLTPEACLDAKGERIEDPATHTYIVRTLSLAGLILLFPLFYGLLRLAGSSIRRRNR